MQLGYDLVWSARRRHWARKEFAGAYRSSSGCPDEGDLRVTGHRDPGQFRGRISMGKAAADGAAVADLIMRDVRDCLSQQRMRGLQPLIVVDVAPAHPGSETHAASINGNIAKPGDSPQIHQHARRR